MRPHTYRRSRGDSTIPAATEVERRWLRVTAAAAYLGIGVGTLNKLRVAGGGPRYAKLSATVIYDVADLDDWLVARKVRSTSETGRVA